MLSTFNSFGDARTRNRTYAKKVLPLLQSHWWVSP